MTPRLSSARAQHYSIQILTGAYVYNNNNNIISAAVRVKTAPISTRRRRSHLLRAGVIIYARTIRNNK